MLRRSFALRCTSGSADGAIGAAQSLLQPRSAHREQEPVAGFAALPSSEAPPSQPLFAFSEAVQAMSNRVLQLPYRVVDSDTQLDEATAMLSSSTSVAVDVEAYVTHDIAHRQLGAISLVQLCSLTAPHVYLVDVMTLGTERVGRRLAPLLTDPTVEKQFFDCRRDVEAFSTQLGVVTAGALDLQLLFTGQQWKLKSVNRRSGMAYVLKSVANIARPETDAAVQLAMTKGNRAVWDVRPLPDHFLAYAAGDVRHTHLLGNAMHETHAPYISSARRITAEYVRYYAASGKPVSVEADVSPAEVSIDWLECFFGPGGVCAFCGQKGHTDKECFRKAAGTAKCTHCGAMGHMAKTCYKRFPQLLKCTGCGQLGHSVERCFKKNPCKHCGGSHASELCHHAQR